MGKVCVEKHGEIKFTIKQIEKMKEKIFMVIKGTVSIHNNVFQLKELKLILQHLQAYILQQGHPIPPSELSDELLEIVRRFNLALEALKTKG